jgi:hypothetical protein
VIIERAGRNVFTVKVPGDNELSCETYDSVAARAGVL